jgi:hypothetical protein
MPVPIDDFDDRRRDDERDVEDGWGDDDREPDVEAAAAVRGAAAGLH